MPRIAEIRVGYVEIPIVTPFDCMIRTSRVAITHGHRIRL
jgi:hypothetical protein